MHVTTWKGRFIFLLFVCKENLIRTHKQVNIHIHEPHRHQTNSHVLRDKQSMRKWKKELWLDGIKKLYNWPRRLLKILRCRNMGARHLCAYKDHELSRNKAWNYLFPVHQASSYIPTASWILWVSVLRQPQWQPLIQGRPLLFPKNFYYVRMVYQDSSHSVGASDDWRQVSP